MSIVLVGSTSGSVTLQEPAVAGTTVIDLPATSGTMVVTGGAQTVQFAAGSASTPSITFTGDTNTGIFSPGADTIAFTEGGTESMRIDSSGNVGIGTSSPLASPRVTISNNSTVTAGGDGGGNGLCVVGTTGIGAGAQLVVVGSDTAAIDKGGAITFGGKFNTGNNDFAQWARVSGYKENGTNTDFGGYLGFYTRPNNLGIFERMRIDSSGNVLVGATSTVSSAQLYVTGSVADRFIRFNNSQPSAPFGVVITYSAASPNDTGKSFLFCADNAATRADIRSNGGLANYSANNVNLSDAREKTNVELAGSYLDKICSIPVKTFNYIDQNREDDDGLTLGVIAQDVQAVAPELVTESDWGTEDNPKMRLSIYQTDLQYALMKAIQEQQAIITDLKARIETLENK